MTCNGKRSGTMREPCVRLRLRPSGVPDAQVREPRVSVWQVPQLVNQLRDAANGFYSNSRGQYVVVMEAAPVAIREWLQIIGGTRVVVFPLRGNWAAVLLRMRRSRSNMPSIDLRWR